MREEPRRPTVHWNEAAAEEILTRAGDPAAGVRMIAVTGPVGAGKSTVARRLSPVVIRSDDYLPDYERVPEAERELPQASDLERLARDLAALRSGRGVLVPVWSFLTHRREGERWVEPAPIVVVEGIHAFEVLAGVTLDLLVYVDAPREKRWLRWEAIESAGERGWGVERARAYFEAVAEPAFQARERRLRDLAHLVVING